MNDNNKYEEKDLLLRIAQGNEQAFRKLVHAYNPLLAPYILKLVKSREKTEEIVQDIFLQIWISRESLREIENIRRYLFVASRNHALNAIRNMLREEKRRIKWMDDQKHTADIPPSVDYSPYLGVLEEAVMQLPEQQRRVWLLCRKNSKKYHEVAAEMNISRETVKKYLQYAQLSISKYVRGKVLAVFAAILF